MAIVEIERKVYSNQKQIWRTVWRAAENQWNIPTLANNGLATLSVGGWVVFFFSAGDAQITSVAFSCDIWDSGQKGIVYLLDHLPSTPDSIPSEAISSVTFDESTGRYYSDQFSSLNVLTEAPHQLFIVFHKTEGSNEYITFSQAVISAEAEDIQPTISLLAPDPSAIQDAGSEITLVWAISGITGYDIADVELQYKPEQSDNWTDLSVTADAKSYTFQAKTLSTVVNRIDWRVRAKTNYSEYSQYVQSSFPIIYYTPAITLIKPVNISIPGDQTITFTWQIAQGSTSVSGTQMCYSEDGGETWTWVLDSSSSVTSKNISGTTFSLGTVLWRVRARDAYGGWGDWAEASFTLSESIPTVSNLKPSGIYQDKAKPIALTWSSSIARGQIAGSELEYDLSDNQGWRSLDTITGADTTYTVPANTFPAVAYADPSQKTGGIRIRVRSKNRNNIFSAWAEASFATVDDISRCTPYQPVLGASRDETAEIQLIWVVTNKLGSAPKGGHVQYRVQDGNWIDLFDETYVEEWAGTDIEKKAYAYNVHANTFPGAMIYWRVCVYNQDGVAGDWSSEAYFSTIDAPYVSTPISPSGTIEDTDSDLVFRWSTSSTSGSTPTGADLQYSYDGITWLVLGHTDGTTQLTVSGGIIHAGTVQWQVRSYNRNGTPGAWSASATFVAHAAPRILDLITDDKPFTTFTWQATDQRDYHIVIDDDLVIGPVFDEVKTYQLTDYLEDGLHTVKIRVQNEMSVWSEWVETQFQVLNIPDGEIELQGSWDIDADLFWEDQAADAEYMVYRDGGLIGTTHSKAFADRVVLGEHRYHVIRRLSDGCYSISNTVSGSMSTRLTRVAPLVGGEWLALVKSENAKRSERFTRRRKVAYHHFSGNKFPTPEIGDQEELIGEYDAAWMHTEEGAKILDSLVGQAIIVKSRSGKVIIGVLEGYTSGEKKHFSGFTFDLKQMDWEDYVCDI